VGRWVDYKTALILYFAHAMSSFNLNKT